MIKLGQNIPSLQAQRRLGQATAEFTSASERLASGQRINKASDDAAGLAVAMSLNMDSRVFAQAHRNLNDGLSAVNIAESAMGELVGIVTRIEELATQSMNSTFGDTQRSAMQKEVTALQSEWNRVVASTSFNGTNLLTGSNTRFVLQGGYGTDGTLAVQVGKSAIEGGFGDSAGATTRVSVATNGTQGNAVSQQLSVSADGRYVAFESDASNLVAGDTNGVSDIFVKDAATGVLTRVSVAADGTEANGYSDFQGFSADGRYVLFTSDATNLVAGDANGQLDVFRKDLQTGEVMLVSRAADGAGANGNSNIAAISADGRHVAFRSSASNLVAGDTNGQLDVFLKDTQTGVVTLVSTTSNGTQGNSFSGNTLSISADGRSVVFQSNASNLVAGDTNGVQDVFLKDVQTGVLTRLSTAADGTEGNGLSDRPAISADGRYVVFRSDASNLVAGDTNATGDIFLRDLQTGVLTRISTATDGTQANLNSYFFGASTISADGRYVAFSSVASNLVAGDTNGTDDVFLKDTQTGVLTRISTATDGTQGNGATGSWASLSADGRFVAFQSNASNLVAGDTNGVQDVFLRDLSKAGVQQMAGMVVSNRVSAGLTLTMAQKYRDELLDSRSRLGATTSRIGTFLNNLQSSKINYDASAARITDADIAAESASAVAAKTKQQVAAAVLAQANQSPQLTLRLLQG